MLSASTAAIFSELGANPTLLERIDRDFKAIRDAKNSEYIITTHVSKRYALAIQDELQKRFPSPPEEMNVLSLGCGDGMDYLAIKAVFPNVKINYVGIDIDKTFINAAKRTFSIFPHARFICADACDIQGLTAKHHLPKNGFAIVLLRQMMIHGAEKMKPILTGTAAHFAQDIHCVIFSCYYENEISHLLELVKTHLLSPKPKIFNHHDNEKVNQIPPYDTARSNADTLNEILTDPATCQLVMKTFNLQSIDVVVKRLKESVGRKAAPQIADQYMVFSQYQTRVYKLFLYVGDANVFVLQLNAAAYEYVKNLARLNPGSVTLNDKALSISKPWLFNLFLQSGILEFAAHLDFNIGQWERLKKEIAPPNLIPSAPVDQSAPGLDNKLKK